MSRNPLPLKQIVAKQRRILILRLINEQPRTRKELARSLKLETSAVCPYVYELIRTGKVIEEGFRVDDVTKRRQGVLRAAPTNHACSPPALTPTKAQQIQILIDSYKRLERKFTVTKLALEFAINQSPEVATAVADWFDTTIEADDVR